MEMATQRIILPLTLTMSRLRDLALELDNNLSYLDFLSCHAIDCQKL